MAYPIPRITDVTPPAAPLRVVGDVHLCEEEPEVEAHFLAWVASLEGTGGSLILLGDIFDLWVDRPMQGDPVPQRALAAFNRLAASGTAVFYMRGNRDVAFRGADGFEGVLWPDPVRTTLGDRTVVFTHGDQLCTSDHAYQGMRRFFYGPGGRSLMLLPYKVKSWMGRGLRQLSRRETGKKPHYAMGIDYADALRWLDAYEASTIVAGHVHTGVHHKHPGPPEREILVLKDWEHGGSVITWDGQALRQDPPVRR